MAAKQKHNKSECLKQIQCLVQTLNLPVWISAGGRREIRLPPMRNVMDGARAGAWTDDKPRIPCTHNNMIQTGGRIHKNVPKKEV